MDKENPPLDPQLWPLDVTAALHNKPRVGEGLMAELPILRPTVLLHRGVFFCILCVKKNLCKANMF